MDDTDRVREGAEHLQRAFLELIAAARVFLDVIEDAVKDPSDITAFANATAERARRAASGFGASGGGGSRRDPDDGVERIRVV